MRAVVDDFVVEDFGENCLYFGNLKKNPLFGMQIHVY